MQIVEKSVFALRAARHTLTSADGMTVATLFPMIHIGTESFYRQVYDDAGSHDVMLVEGVRSPVVALLTSSYRWMNTARLGLIVQPRSPVDGTVKARVVHADLTRIEFNHEWRRVPLWMRVLAALVAPLLGLIRRFTASRESIAKNLELEDRLSAKEILLWDPQFAVFKQCVLGARDERLIAKLGNEIDRRSEPERLNIAVVYGAQHMRAVLSELRRRGFQTTGSSWLTVFTFD
ncbi:MAG: hypothetical protein HOP95_11995 [Sphingomonas sp.]|nr:hypothetical protein [Sphingomonas sp.]